MKNRTDIPISEIVDRLNERVEDVVRSFWPGAVRPAPGNVIYPNPGRDDLGSFQVYLTSHGRTEAYHWKRYSQNRGGNVLNLIAYGLAGETDHKPASYAPAVLWAKQFLGIERPESPAERAAREKRIEDGRRRREAEAAREAERQARHVADILRWSHAVDRADADNPVVRYLTGEPRMVAGRNVGNRGIDLAAIEHFVSPVRFHPSLRHWSARVTLPAMVHPVVGPNGKTAVHCTFLDPGGVGKAKSLAKGASAKLMRGDIAGGMVPICLGPTGMTVRQAEAAGVSSPLIIGEGTETGYGLACGVSDQARVVSALSITNIGNLVWLAKSPAVSVVVVAIENDVKPAAVRERDRVMALLEDGSGKRVLPMRAHEGSDFADLY